MSYSATPSKSPAASGADFPVGLLIFTIAINILFITGVVLAIIVCCRRCQQRRESAMRAQATGNVFYFYAGPQGVPLAAPVSGVTPSQAPSLAMYTSALHRDPYGAPQLIPMPGGLPQVPQSTASAAVAATGGSESWLHAAPVIVDDDTSCQKLELDKLRA